MYSWTQQLTRSIVGGVFGTCMIQVVSHISDTTIQNIFLVLLSLPNSDSIPPTFSNGKEIIFINRMFPYSSSTTEYELHNYINDMVDNFNQYN